MLMTIRGSVCANTYVKEVLPIVKDREPLVTSVATYITNYSSSIVLVLVVVLLSSFSFTRIMFAFYVYSSIAILPMQCKLHVGY